MASAAKSMWLHRLGRMLLTATPLLATLLLCAMVALLYFYGERQAREAEQTALLTDSLWSEQAIQFQVNADEEALARLALESARNGATPQTMRPSLVQFMTSNPEIIALRWVDAFGDTRIAIPPDAPLPPAHALADLLAREQKASRRLRYTEPRLARDGARLIDMVAPITRQAEGSALLIATLSLDALLLRHLPWWISERYNVRLVDAEGEVLAAKPRDADFDENAMHGMGLNSLIPGAMLQISPRTRARADGNRLLLVSTGGLAMLSVLALLFAHRHVQRRLAAEQALGMEMAFRRAMEDSLTVGMRARDRQGCITYVNPAFCRMVGMTKEELEGMSPPMPYWDPGDLETARAWHDRVLQGDAPAEGFELRFRHKDGTMLDVLIYESPLIDAEGNHVGWMASILDVTERKRAEERAKAQEASLQRTARLVTMGEMASTLAHELNQPLAAIASYAAGSLNMIRSGRGSAEEIAPALEKLEVQARRAGHIIRRVHDFVRKSEPRIVPCDLGPVIHESAEFAEAEVRKHRVRIEIDMPAGLPVVAADPILIQQVLLNLIRNGSEAMAQTRKQERVLELKAQDTGEGVEIRVEDRGSGVPEALRERLFEAFVSSKPDGMGMGLNICRSIIEMHKGRLSVAAREGGGTVFTILLPQANVLEKAS